MTTSAFHVTDMHCASCESRITHALKSLPGINLVRANPVSREVFVDHDHEKTTTLELFNRIESLGFAPIVEGTTDSKEHHSDLKRLGIAGISMMQVVMQAIALYIGAYQNMAQEHVRLRFWAGKRR